MLTSSLLQSCPHIDVRTGPGQHFVFTIETDDNVTAGTVAFSLPQRKWATLSLNQVRLGSGELFYIEMDFSKKFYE